MYLSTVKHSSWVGSQWKTIQKWHCILNKNGNIQFDILSISFNIAHNTMFPSITDKIILQYVTKEHQYVHQYSTSFTVFNLWLKNKYIIFGVYKWYYVVTILKSHIWFKTIMSNECILGFNLVGQRSYSHFSVLCRSDV